MKILHRRWCLLYLCRKCQHPFWEGMAPWWNRFGVHFRKQNRCQQAWRPTVRLHTCWHCFAALFWNRFWRQNWNQRRNNYILLNIRQSLHVKQQTDTTSYTTNVHDTAVKDKKCWIIYQFNTRIQSTTILAVSKFNKHILVTIFPLYVMEWMLTNI